MNLATDLIKKKKLGIKLLSDYKKKKRVDFRLNTLKVHNVTLLWMCYFLYFTEKFEYFILNTYSADNS